MVVLIAPIPRYITKKCCEDPCHTENYNCNDFEFEIVSGIETHKRLLESWANDLSMNYVIVDATELADPAEPILRNRTTRVRYASRRSKTDQNGVERTHNTPYGPSRCSFY